MIRQPMKNDSGQVLVIVALLMVVLLGVSAVAIDIGIEKVAVTRLKNVANASALAGATAKALGTSVTDAVHASILANGIPLLSLVPTSEVTPNPKVIGDTVQVSLSEPHTFFLAPILGFTTTTITQSAEATLIPSSGGVSPFNYAIFSHEPLTLTSSAYITGGVHCNSTVALGGLSGSAGSYFTGGIENIGGAFYNGTLLGGSPVYPTWMNTSSSGTINAAKTGPFNNNATSIPIEMAGALHPATIATNLYNQALAKNHVVTATNWQDTLHPNTSEPWNSALGYQWKYSSGTFSMSGSNPKLLDGPWYFEGNLSVFPGGSLTANGAVVATGKISIGGGQLLSTAASGPSGVAFYSLLGSPEYPNPSNKECIVTSISDSNNTTMGTFYAPYGTINFGGGVPKITGSVIGKTVKTSNSITVTYDANVNQLLTGTGSTFRAYLTK